MLSRVGRAWERSPASSASTAASAARGNNAVRVVDGAGWHRSKALEVPANVSHLRLSHCSPELNPMETVFAHLMGGFLANRVFETVDDVLRELLAARGRLALDPQRVATITARSCASCIGEPHLPEPTS